MPHTLVLVQFSASRDSRKYFDYDQENSAFDGKCARLNSRMPRNKPCFRARLTVDLAPYLPPPCELAACMQPSSQLHRARRRCRQIVRTEAEATESASAANHIRAPAPFQLHRLSRRHICLGVSCSLSSRDRACSAHGKPCPAVPDGGLVLRVPPRNCPATATSHPPSPHSSARLLVSAWPPAHCALPP